MELSTILTQFGIETILSALAVYYITIQPKNKLVGITLLVHLSTITSHLPRRFFLDAYTHKYICVCVCV